MIRMVRRTLWEAGSSALYTRFRDVLGRREFDERATTRLRSPDDSRRSAGGRPEPSGKRSSRDTPVGGNRPRRTLSRVSRRKMGMVDREPSNGATDVEWVFHSVRV